ncbi:MAG TPA: N-acyl homoserine lactonase family protein [Syntrophomonadaceae bacterium]|nr:N-acyl homoserine lactonase family protein [Syntrophomonadaceae bacterium]HPR92871.1 N-acyl homoserine lactonase family protein [Syntrophomonadaceae bacterium]
MNHLIYPIYNGSFTVGMGNMGFFPDVKNIPSYAFLIINENNGRAILIDTGFNPANIPGVDSTSVHYNDHHFDEVLSRFGWQTEDIETVVMTHLHWDHTGAIAKFPRARICVQAEEFRSLVHLPVNEECSFCPSHWLPYLPQFELLEGSSEIEPGLKVIFNSGHTAGHQVIEVQTAEGKIILGGDAPFNYTLMWEKAPDSYWQSFRSGPGSRFYWENHVRKTISSFLTANNSLSRERPARMRLSEIRGRGEKFFTSHDPGLSCFADGRPISFKSDPGPAVT